MIPLFLYCLVATIVTASFNRLGLKWWHTHLENSYEAPPKIAFAIAYGVFWPITLFCGGPVVLVYKLVNKLIDKFTKV